MLFENINQFKKAKSLLENNESLENAFVFLRKDNDFKNMSDSELQSAIGKMHEGIGEKILNAASKMLGGDVSKIDTVLSQMKDQELKFNREENEICVEFYNLLQKKEAIKKEKNNPEYTNLIKEINQAMNSLNVRMNGLTESHEKIFNALEEKIKSLTDKSNRKKKYFNAKRASDVLITQSDRYEKIKSITGKNTERINSLEKFLGINVEEVEKDIKKTENQANVALKNITTPSEKKENLTNDPEKGFFKKFELIKNSDQEIKNKKQQIGNIIKNVNLIIRSTDFNSYEEERRQSIINFLIMMEKEVDLLDKNIDKNAR
jgi:hypothetical protein